MQGEDVTEGVHSTSPLVYLIGGSSSVGKSTLAGALASRVSAQVLHLDDLTIAVDYPAARLPAHLPGIWSRSAEELRNLLIAKERALTPGLQRLVSHCLQDNGLVVIEGEGIGPDLARTWAGDERVSCTFVVEEDVDRIFDTLTVRTGGRPLSDENRAIRQKVAHMDALYGRCLREQAEMCGLRWVPSQPWNTLIDRYF